MLAREGYEVTVLDPDVSMLAEVERRLADEPGRVRRRVEMVTGIGERIAETVGGDFDGVCCHSVLMYIEDPQPLIDAMVSATRPSGLVSILTVNPRAAAMRAGLQQRWDDAIASLRTARNRDSQVVTTYAHGIAAVTDKLGSAGAQVTSWHGVGVFTDHLPKQNLADVAERPLDPNLLEAEWLAGMVDPYRQVARSVHLMARRRPENARSWLRG